MPSFRSILLFATTALAGFAAAAPLASSPIPAPADVTPAVTGLSRRCDCQSIPDVFANVKAQVDVVVGKCNDAKADVNVKVDVYVDILTEVKAIIDAAVVDLKAFVNVDAKVLLLSQGKLVDIKVCAQIIADVVIAICTLLSVVLKACVSLDVSVIVKVIADINVCLAELLKVCFGLVAGLDVQVCGLIKVVANILVSIKLVDVLAIVKAHVQILGISL